MRRDPENNEIYPIPRLERPQEALEDANKALERNKYSTKVFPLLLKQKNYIPGGALAVLQTAMPITN